MANATGNPAVLGFPVDRWFCDPFSRRVCLFTSDRMRISRRRVRDMRLNFPLRLGQGSIRLGSGLRPRYVKRPRPPSIADQTSSPRESAAKSLQEQ